MSAQDRASRRWGMQSEPPNRDPDVEAHAWIENGEVSWTYIAWPAGPFHDFDHGQQVAALTDMVWNHASDPKRVEWQDRQFLWVQISNTGDTTYLFPNIEERATFAQIRWMLRRLLRLNGKFLKLIWLHARGRSE